MRRCIPLWGLPLLLATAGADRLVLHDGRVIENCYIRDEGVRLVVWKRLEDVGTDRWTIYPRRLVKEFQIERDAAWDAKPNLPDLTITHIELNPKLAGLHGRVEYDQYGRPRIAGGSLPDLGERAYMQPEAVVQGLKFQYTPGETLTMTAHVKNVGFADAAPFEYVWRVDDKEIARGRVTKRLKPQERIELQTRWQWQEGFHHVQFQILTNQREIATINNQITDPLWGFAFFYIVHKERVKVWNEFRNAYGTFAWEDYYRWHLEIMNLLFEQSVYPSAPEGIKARVRLDRIIYADDIDEAVRNRFSADGIAYDQGGWIFVSDEDRARTWKAPEPQWRNNTEWSLPHELGHQLGLTDLYVLDYHGHENHRMPDNGDMLTHYYRGYKTMMHWHGPHLWSEVCAGYLNRTWNKPRGHFGDYYFALPAENFLQVVDVNGLPVAGARVEIFQRGVVVDTSQPPQQQAGVRFYAVVEDGNFGHPVSSDPVIVGETDAQGLLRLPNRPVQEVRTLNGYHRRPNPFGNINVVGQRGLLLVRITQHDRPCYYWLEITDFLIAYLRGHTERYTLTLRTPYGSPDSPPAPRNLQVERIDEHQVRLRWDAPEITRDQHSNDIIVAYRVYRRVSSDGLNDRPWFPVATLTPDTRSAVIDLRLQMHQDLYWFSNANRFAVSTVGTGGVESALVEIVLPRE
ncbi:MAG: fibronectin type III domain-containing protein [Fimbriimonadales bacterium]|nr:MAG: hypothetical protein KatS3mg018_0300 [Fimbriimonadales bacterium]